MDPRRRAAWRNWYAAALGQLSDIPGAEILASWERLARPVALRRDPGHPLNRPPASPPIGTAIVHDEAGAPYLVIPAPPLAAPEDGWRLVPGRGDWQVLVPASATSDWPNASWRVHGPNDRAGKLWYDGLRSWGISERTDTSFRSGPQVRALVRALLVRGLMDDGLAPGAMDHGLTHGAAVRQWLTWHRENGSLMARDIAPKVLAAADRIAARTRGSRHLAQRERDDRLRDRARWSSWESGLRREHRRLWHNLGIIGPDGSATATVFAFR